MLTRGSRKYGKSHLAISTQMRTWLANSMRQTGSLYAKNGFAMSPYPYTMTCERSGPENVRDDAKVVWLCKRGLAHRTSLFYRIPKSKASSPVCFPCPLNTPRMRGTSAGLQVGKDMTPACSGPLSSSAILCHLPLQTMTNLLGSIEPEHTNTSLAHGE